MVSVRGSSRRSEGPHITGFWYRWATAIERRPVLPSLAALAAVVVVIALPVFSLHLGLDHAASDPPGSTALEAYDPLARGFGPGFSARLQLGAELPFPPASLASPP